jgi:NADH-quinone oxidoreductase subunit E
MEEQLIEILAPYKGEKGALIPILQKVQQELGYLFPEAVSEIARNLRISGSEVYGVLTFYAQFRTIPIGRNLVRVCRGTGCHVKGGARIRMEVEKQLGIKAGETTPDLEYTLETVACLGCCALAPTMMINDEVYGQMTIKKVAEIFAAKRRD